MNKIAHDISVRDTNQNDFIKNEITSSVLNILHEIAFIAYCGHTPKIYQS